MGAATFTPDADGGLRLQGRFKTPVINNKRVVTGGINLSTSYATGGDTLALGGTGLTEVTAILTECVYMLGFGNTGGYSIVLRGTPGAPLIQAYDANGTEISAAANLSGRIAIPVFLLGS